MSSSSHSITIFGEKQYDKTTTSMEIEYISSPILPSGETGEFKITLVDDEGEKTIMLQNFRGGTNLHNSEKLEKFFDFVSQMETRYGK